MTRSSQPRRDVEAWLRGGPALATQPGFRIADAEQLLDGRTQLKLLRGLLEVRLVH